MTFPTGVVEIRKCSDNELKTVLDEAREASKHSRKLGRVMGIVAAHRIQQMKDPLIFEKLATWRRMNNFDRVADGRTIGFMVLVRSHPLRRNTPLICGAR